MLTMSFKNKNNFYINSGYHFIHAVNHKAKQVFVSNVFYCDEMPSKSDIYDLIENELDYDVENVNECQSSFHEEENYMSDARNKEIKWANEHNYKVIKFDVFCKNDKIHLK